MNSSDILRQATQNLPTALNKLIILDPKILQPVVALQPRKGILDALETAHKSGWKIMMISNQFCIASGERTLSEVLDMHQATMARYGGLITDSLFTPNQGGEMILTRCGMGDIGQFHTQSSLSKKIARHFNVTPSENWFLLPRMGLVMAAIALARSDFKTTLLISAGDPNFTVIAATTGIQIAHSTTFEKNGFSNCA